MIALVTAMANNFNFSPMWQGKFEALCRLLDAIIDCSHKSNLVVWMCSTVSHTFKQELNAFSRNILSFAKET